MQVWRCVGIGTGNPWVSGPLSGPVPVETVHTGYLPKWWETAKFWVFPGLNFIVGTPTCNPMLRGATVLTNGGFGPGKLETHAAGMAVMGKIQQPGNNNGENIPM